MFRWALRVPLFLVAITVAAIPQFVQQLSLGVEDYRHAEKFMGYATDSLVHRSAVHPSWLPDGRFWYRNSIPEGSEFVVVDPAKGIRQAAFNHARLAKALSAAAGAQYDMFHLPISGLELSAENNSISIVVSGRRFSCDVREYQCTKMDAIPESNTSIAVSPDRKRLAFLRDNNIWVRDTSTGRETRLTTDGVTDYGYGTDNAGWRKSDRPVLLWSPDSKKIATFRHDSRGVGEMALVETKVGHPTVTTWKYPLPGDDKIFMIERVVIDVESAKVIRFKMPPDPHRSSLCDDVVCGGVWADVQWSADSSQVAFVSTSRDHKTAQLRVADAATGTVRDVLNERVNTYFESGNDVANWRFLPASNEVIWFSERDNWGQLYLCDLSGQLKNSITTGTGNVTQLLRVDERNRLLYFLAVGKEQGRDPYFIHLYRIGFDGRGMLLLTPEDAAHDIRLSPSGSYFVDSYSKPNVPPVSVLRAADGKLVVTLEKADVSKLAATDWKPPTPITVKARDGVTDLYGLMFLPSNLDTKKKYPIINHIYPGPQTGSVGSREFSPSRGDAQSLAELGFVVVEIDGMGTPLRSKSFHDTGFGDMSDNTLADQVAGMRELSERYSWIDLQRVGIYGHSGGGYAAAAAMFRYPEFFKVGVAEAGNYDNRNYEDDWGEKWQGLLQSTGGASTNYDNQAIQNIAKNLTGHLLLAHGALDDNVPPYSTLLVVNELIRANKDFDLILLPDRGHAFGDDSYMMRRRWDYFVRYLLGAEPPREYAFRAPR